MAKRKDQNTFCLYRPQKALQLGLSLIPSNTAWRLLLPQILMLCLLTHPAR